MANGGIPQTPETLTFYPPITSLQFDATTLGIDCPGDRSTSTVQGFDASQSPGRQQHDGTSRSRASRSSRPRSRAPATTVVLTSRARVRHLRPLRRRRDLHRGQHRLHDRGHRHAEQVRAGRHRRRRQEGQGARRAATPRPSRRASRSMPTASRRRSTPSTAAFTKARRQGRLPGRRPPRRQPRREPRSRPPSTT